MKTKLDEIPIGSPKDIKSLFPGRQLEMVVGSIADKNTCGRLWTYAPDDPGVFTLLWDQGNNNFYLTGYGESSSIEVALRDLIAEEIRHAAAADAPYFAVRALTAETAELPRRAFGGFLRGHRDCLIYSLPPEGHDSEPDPAADASDILLVPIDQTLWQMSYENVQPVKDEIRWMWPSLQRYLQRGWGTAAVADGRVVCWCTAEYVSDRLCGTGIETVRDMHNRGLATAVAARFIGQSLKWGCIPHWECSVDNPASARVAEKLGLRVVEESSFFVGKFD